MDKDIENLIGYGDVKNYLGLKPKDARII